MGKALQVGMAVDNQTPVLQNTRPSESLEFEPRGQNCTRRHGARTIGRSKTHWAFQPRPEPSAGSNGWHEAGNAAHNGRLPAYGRPTTVPAVKRGILRGFEKGYFGRIAFQGEYVSDSIVSTEGPASLALQLSSMLLYLPVCLIWTTIILSAGGAKDSPPRTGGIFGLW